MNRLILTIAGVLITLSVFSQRINRGTIDLRGKIEPGSQVYLDGDWFFYWEHFQNPNQIDSSASIMANFPEVWNTLNDEDQGFASYQLKVLLDPNQKLAVATPAVYNAYRFFINGELVTSNGKVGETKDSTVPHWRQLTVPVEMEILQDTNIFTLHISGFRHSRAGPVDSIVLGDRDKMISNLNIAFAIDAFLSGSLVMGGLFFLGLFLFGRRLKTILYFSLFCLAFSYYIFGSGNYLLHYLFPKIPWLLTFKLEYLTIYAITVLLVKYTYKTYPYESLSRFEKPLVWIPSLYLILSVVLPPKILTNIHTYFLVLMVAVIVLGLYIYILAFINKRPGAKYSTIGTCVILLALLLRALHQLQLIYVPIYIMPIGYMIFFFLQSVTISEQVAIAWQKVQRDATASMKAKSDFLSTMSHEIRTPMNAVIGLTHHLLDSQPRKDQEETLQTLKFSSENLLRLINDILDYNKMESGKLDFEESVFNLHELGNNLTAGLKASLGERYIDVVFEYDPDLTEMHIGDSGKLVQVLSNLLNNAIKFTKEGSVTLIMRLADRQPEKIGVQFQVIDTGIGISKRDQKKIFEEFNQANNTITRQYGGTGLGLAITKKILELQGVNIQLNSEPGKGTTFSFVQYFNIPKGIRKKSQPKKVPVDPLKDMRILLVEDNNVNVMVAKRFLSRWHCLVDVAGNGLEALDKYEDDKYDLILMDLQMPEMDGYQTTRRLRSQGVKLPIIALTASVLMDVKGRIKEAGLDDFVTKPFHPDHLHQKLVQYLVPNES